MQLRLPSRSSPAKMCSTRVAWPDYRFASLSTAIPIDRSPRISQSTFTVKKSSKGRTRTVSRKICSICLPWEWTIKDSAWRTLFDRSINTEQHDISTFPCSSSIFMLSVSPLSYRWMNFGLLVYARKNTRVSLSLDLVISRGLVTIFHQTRDDRLPNFGRNTRRNSTCFVDYVRTFCFSYDEAILLKSTNRVLTMLSIHNISLRISTCNIETFASKTLISTAIEKY